MVDDQERREMPKVQKSLLLNEEVARLVEAYQKVSGVNFTRTVTAALLQYLLSDPKCPQARWLQFAVSLDDGDATIESIVQSRLDQAKEEHDLHNRIHSLLIAVHDSLEKLRKKDPESVGKISALFDEAEKTNHSFTLRERFALAGWMKVAQGKDTEVIERILAHWLNPVAMVGYAGGTVLPDRLPLSSDIRKKQ